MSDQNNEQKDEFWGEDDPPDRGDRPARSGGGMSSQQRKAIPIVAAAAALLLIVVIFVVARNSDGKKSATPTSVADTNQSSNATPKASGSSGGTSSAPSTKKRTTQWPVSVISAPKAFEGPGRTLSLDVPAPGNEPPPGIYVWVGFDGWHLRVVRGDGIGEVKGTVQGNLHGRLDNANVTKVINADPGAAKADNRIITFDFPAGDPRVTGLNFDYELFTNQVDFRFEGPAGPIDPTKVYLGSGKVPAPTNPISFMRR